MKAAKEKPKIDPVAVAARMAKEEEERKAKEAAEEAAAAEAKAKEEAAAAEAAAAKEAAAQPEPVAEAPATEAPATDAPATDAPATETPADEAPATDASAAAPAPVAPEGPTRCKAVVPYTAKTEGELSFEVGDIIFVPNFDPEAKVLKGMYFSVGYILIYSAGVCNGKTGSFPAMFAENTVTGKRCGPKAVLAGFRCRAVGNYTAKVCHYLCHTGLTR